jgi:hypothetical protein
MKATGELCSPRDEFAPGERKGTKGNERERKPAKAEIQLMCVMTRKGNVQITNLRNRLRQDVQENICTVGRERTVDWGKNA